MHACIYDLCFEISSSICPHAHRIPISSLMQNNISNWAVIRKYSNANANANCACTGKLNSIGTMKYLNRIRCRFYGYPIVQWPNWPHFDFDVLFGIKGRSHVQIEKIQKEFLSCSFVECGPSLGVYEYDSYMCASIGVYGRSVSCHQCPWRVLALCERHFSFLSTFLPSNLNKVPRSINAKRDTHNKSVSFNIIFYIHSFIRHLRFTSRIETPVLGRILFPTLFSQTHA